ncbi:hypothetical protein [Qipengyuania nanhaisediminis]|uniref:hypothetical protein n=1 Tax=Qipengyuania nanhaisediminis TaxID=604088 RepID=UPI0038B236A2
MIKQTAFSRFGRALAVFACTLGLVTLPQTGLAQSDQSDQSADSWSLEPDARVEIGFVSAQSTTSEEQLVIAGDAFTVRGQVGIGFENETTRLRLEADRIEVFRLEEGRSNSHRDRFTATFDQEIGDDWEVQLRARHYDDFVTAESADTDEWQGSARITYEPASEHRFRLRGTWRSREYANGAAAETHGEGARIDAQYRRRFDRYHYLTFDLRAENITSDDPRRGYDRQSARVSYTLPVTPDLRVRPAIEVIQTEFDSRIGDDGAARRDRLVVPEIELLYWPGQWRAEAEAKYIFADSNDAFRDRAGYRLTLSIGYAF